MLSHQLTAKAVQSSIASLDVDADYRTKLIEAATAFATPDKSREEIQRYTTAAYMAFRLAGPVTRAVFSRFGLDPWDVDNRDQYNELYQQAFQFILRLAQKNAESSYLFTAAKRHLLTSWFADTSLRVPPSTYYDHIARGDEPPSFQHHSWQEVFNGNGLRRIVPNTSHRERHDQSRIAPDVQQAGVRQVVPTIWNRAAEQWLAPDSCYEEDRQAAETWELVLTFCRDATDVDILRLRCEGLEDDDVADVLGISRRTVSRRRRRIAIAYCVFHDWRTPGDEPIEA